MQIFLNRTILKQIFPKRCCLTSYKWWWQRMLNENQTHCLIWQCVGTEIAQMFQNIFRSSSFSQHTTSFIWEHSSLGVSSLYGLGKFLCLPLDSAIRVRFPGVARGIAAPWPLGTAWEFRLALGPLLIWCLAHNQPTILDSRFSLELSTCKGFM